MSLIVEDGSGKSDAQSYVSVVDADTIARDYLDDEVAWTKLNTEDKEKALKSATLYIDGGYGSSFIGYRKSTTQALEWPRFFAIASNGRSFTDTEIPSELKRATVEMAVRHVSTSGGLMADVDTGRNVKREFVKVGPIEEEVEYVGSKPTSVRYEKISFLIRQLVGGGGYMERA